MPRKDTVSIRVSRTKHKALKTIADFIRMDLTECADEALEHWIEGPGAVYMQRRHEDLKKPKYRRTLSA